MKKTSGLTYCEATTAALLETDMELMKFYQAGIDDGESPDIRLSLVFSAAIQYQPAESMQVKMYKELEKEYRFVPEKMQALVKQDRLLSMVLKDLLSNKHEEEFALMILFNSYVLDDFVMRDCYKKIECN